MQVDTGHFANRLISQIGSYNNNNKPCFDVINIPNKKLTVCGSSHLHVAGFSCFLVFLKDIATLCYNICVTIKSWTENSAKQCFAALVEGLLPIKPFVRFRHLIWKCGNLVLIWFKNEGLFVFLFLHDINKLYKYLIFGRILER